MASDIAVKQPADERQFMKTIYDYMQYKSWDTLPVWRSKAIIGLNGKTLGFDLNSNLMKSWYTTNFIIERSYLCPLSSMRTDRLGDTVSCLWYFVSWISPRTVFFVSGVDDRNTISLEYVVFCQTLIFSHKSMQCYAPLHSSHQTCFTRFGCSLATGIATKYPWD